MFQTIGSYIDVIIFFVGGILFFLFPEKIIRKDGTEEDRRKRIKVIKICGAGAVVISILMLVLRFFTVGAT